MTCDNCATTINVVAMAVGPAGGATCVACYPIMRDRLARIADAALQAAPRVIQLRSRADQAAHGRDPGHDEAEPRWGVFGGHVAMCSCSALIVHDYDSDDATERGMTCSMPRLRGQAPDRTPLRCELEASDERMADGRPLWRCARCGGLTSVSRSDRDDARLAGSPPLATMRAGPGLVDPIPQAAAAKATLVPHGAAMVSARACLMSVDPAIQMAGIRLRNMIVERDGPLDEIDAASIAVPALPPDACDDEIDDACDAIRLRAELDELARLRRRVPELRRRLDQAEAIIAAVKAGIGTSVAVPRAELLVLLAAVVARRDKARATAGLLAIPHEDDDETRAAQVVARAVVEARR